MPQRVDIYIQVFFTSALGAGEWSRYPVGISPQNPLDEAGWAPEPVWMTWRGENLAPTGNRTSTSRPFVYVY
jgi:hypothetical protein